MRYGIIAIAFAASTLAACDYPLFPDEDDVDLRTDRSVYDAGDTATLRLYNESGETVGYNLCVHLVQQRVDERWTDTLYGDGGPCTGMWYHLRHGDMDTYPAALDADMPAGTYRFRTRVDMDSEGEFTVYSRSFEVQ